MKRRILSLLLLMSMILALFCAQPVSAVNSVKKTDDEIITATMTYLNIKEGNCNSVNANDMGAVSIGMIQWHGTRALNILKQIVALIPDYALEVLGEDFYNEILTAKNWETRIVNAEEKAALIVLLSTEESKQVQIAQAKEDISGYLAHAKRMGLTTAAQQMYFMDIENQYGSGGAERMLKYAKEASGLSKFDNLTQFHNGMRKAAYQLEYNNSVTPYMPRRESTYKYIVETLKWETDVPYCVMTAPCGADGEKHQSFEITSGSFTFPENPYTREGYEFIGWNMHRQPSNTWYVANIGWCSAGWITQQGYTKCLYKPGQTQMIDSKFLSSGSPGSAYILEPVWRATDIGNTDPICVHDWQTDSGHAATCTAGGYTLTVCMKCGETIRVDEAVKGHDYGTWTVLQAATCASAGLRSTTCSRCGLVQTDVIAPLDHQPVTEQLSMPSCTKEGQTITKCSLCQAVISTQTVPATGHKAGTPVTEKAPTCTADGRSITTCTVCGEIISAEILPAQHSFTDWTVYTPATELGDGVRTRTCTVCGLFEMQKIPGGNHEHSYTKTTVAPTCESEGYDLYLCGCGASYKSGIVAPLGHQAQSTVTKATCCTDGFAVNTCTRCNAVWMSSTEPALGHNWDAGTVTKSATAASEGLMTYTCKRCGEKKTETIAASSTCPGGSACPGHRFTDMPSGWAHAGLDFCVENGLISGTSDTKISPNTKMTRAMLVAVLYRLEGSPAVSGSSSFTDVPKNSWFYNAVLWGTGCGVVSGTGGKTFSPNGYVTREQIATILYRYAIYKNYDFTTRARIDSYPDSSKVSTYAKSGMQWAVGMGLISGRASGGKNYLVPGDGATRAEVASILMRMINNLRK